MSAIVKQIIGEQNGDIDTSGEFQANPEERREVQIGRRILYEIQLGYDLGCGRGWDEQLNVIVSLADELIQMHSPPPRS